MLNNHQRLKLVDVRHEVVLVGIGSGDLGILEGLSLVAHVETDDAMISALGKDVWPYYKEGVVAAQFGIEFWVCFVGMIGSIEVDSEVSVVWVSSGVVDDEPAAVPFFISPA